MEIKRSGSQPSVKGPSDWFTGSPHRSTLQPPDPARVQGASVTVEPVAPTAWHTHPLGQTLIVTVGCGWVQRDGGPIEEIRTGQETLARSHRHHRHDPHRHSGKAQRQRGRLAGTVSDEQYLVRQA